MAAAGHPIPFNSGTQEVIYENNTLRFLIYKKDFERQVRYALDDHLFHVKMELQPGVQNYPRLSNMCGVIENVCFNVLRKLHQYYYQPNIVDAEHDMEVDITIAESNLDHGIHIGNFSLSEDLRFVANYAGTKLWDWLSSGYAPFELKANASFCLFYKVLSVSHLREKLGLDQNFIVNKIGDNLRAHRRRVFPRGADGVGASVDGARKSSKYLLATPKGFKKNELAFHEECLLVSLILGKEINSMLENRPPPADKSSLSLHHYLQGKCFSKSNPMSLMAGHNLLHKLNSLKSILGLAGTSGPRDIQLCAKVAALWNCQIAVFSSHCPPIVERIFPNPFDLSLPSIFILQSSEIASDISHFDVIRNIRTFYNVRGFACVGDGCKYRLKRYRRMRHLCRSVNCKACPCCHRTLMSKDTYVNKHLSALYCNSAICQDLKENCQDCNMLLLTKSCHQAHAGCFCRAKGKFCSECSRHVRPDHVCARLCRNCWKIKDSGHQCQVSHPPQLQEFPNLSFVSFESTSSPAKCLSCYELQKKEQDSTVICAHHIEHAVHTKPICVSVLYEDQSKELFSRVTFFDGEVERREERSVLNFPYLNHASVDPKMRALSREHRTGRYGKPSGRKNMSLEENLAQLSRKKRQSPVEQFILFFVRPIFRNFTFLVSDFDGMSYLLKGITDCNIIPTGGLNKGNRSVQFGLPYDIRFVCSPQYLAGTILQRRQQYGLEIPLRFFPGVLWHQFKQDGFGLLDTIPGFEYFVDLGDSREMWQEKQRHWDLLNQAAAEKWNPIDQLHLAITSHLEVLALSSLHFLKESISLQYDCLQQFGEPAHIKKDRLTILHPFSCYNGSLASFIYSTFRHFAMKDETLYAIENEYGRKIQTSRGEMETTEFLRSNNKSWKTHYSSPEGQQKFIFQKRLICTADAYNSDTKVAFFFNGCHWHGHNCRLAKGGDAMGRKRAQDFSEKMKKLLQYFPAEVKRILVLYECEWLKIRKQCTPVAEFLKEPSLRCIHRLRVRDAYKGAIVESFNLKWILKPDALEDFVIVDVASLFPAMCLKYPIPVGKARTIMGDELMQADVQMTEEGFYYKQKRCYGVCQVIVYPPTDCLYARLYSTVDGKYIGFLCRTCATKRQKRNMAPCNHSDRERCYYDVYSTEELTFAAVKHGYRYFFLEMFLYDKADFLLRDFVTRLAYNKIKHSPFPAGVSTEEEKERYVSEINKRMNFKEILKLELSPGIIDPSPEKRTFFKQCLNAMIGAFGTNRQKHRNSEYITNAAQLYAHHQTGQIVQIQSLGNMLRLVLKSDEIKLNRRANVMVSIFVTSNARIEMFNHLDSIIASGGTPFRLSCDSLYFTFKKNQPLPFVLSECFGDFKRTHEDVRGFVQLGPSAASTIYQENGELKTDSRVCGLQLNNLLGQQLTFSKFSALIDQAIVDDLFNVKGEDLKVDSLRTLHKNLTVASVRRQQTVSGRRIFERRQVDYLSENLRTYPFGFRP